MKRSFSEDFEDQFPSRTKNENELKSEENNLSLKKDRKNTKSNNE